MAAIAAARGVPSACVVPAAGSSELIFTAFRDWLAGDSRVLILDPTYGEYPFVLERVVGCRVDRLPLRREQNYDLDLEALAAQLRDGYDLVVLVNPNSPTGRHVPAADLRAVLRRARARRSSGSMKRTSTSWGRRNRWSVLPRSATTWSSASRCPRSTRSAA